MTTLANLNRLTANLDETQRGIGAAFASAGANFDRLAADLDASAVALRREVLPEVTAGDRESGPDRGRVPSGRRRGAAARTAAGWSSELPPILEKLERQPRHHPGRSRST